MTVARFSARDYLLRDWRWLLDLDVAGRVIRLAEEALEAPVGDDAALVPYLAGLEWAGEVPDSTDMRTIEVSLYLDQIDSTPQLIEDGLDLGGAVGTLRLWSRPSGQVVTVLVGQLRSVSYGLPGDPVVCSIEELSDDDPGGLPAVGARVSLETWAAAADLAMGEMYPDVIGEPGLAGSRPAPALMVVESSGTEKLLIAGHPSVAGEAGGNVLVVNDSDGTTATLAAAHSYDGLNRVVTTVSLGTPGSLTVNAGHRYWVSWSGSGGGRRMPDGSAMRGAGQVVRWMLGHARSRVDMGRIAAALSMLDEYQIDTVIQAAPGTQISPWDWILEHIEPIAPVRLVSSVDGHYLAPRPATATAADAEVHLDADAGQAELASPVTYAGSEPASDVVLSYGSDPRAGTYTEQIVASGDPDAADGVRSSLYLRRAWSKYRDHRGEPVSRVVAVQSDVIEDAGTAAAVLALLCQLHAGPTRRVMYEADADLAGRLERGSVITLTHSAMGWSSKVWIVDAATLRLDGTVLLDLREPV